MKITLFDLRTQEEVFTVSLKVVRSLSFPIINLITSTFLQLKYSLVIESARSRAGMIGKKRVRWTLLNLHHSRKRSRDSQNYKSTSWTITPGIDTKVITTKKKPHPPPIPFGLVNPIELTNGTRNPSKYERIEDLHVVEQAGRISVNSPRFTNNSPKTVTVGSTCVLGSAIWDLPSKISGYRLPKRCLYM